VRLISHPYFAWVGTFLKCGDLMVNTRACRPEGDWQIRPSRPPGCGHAYTFQESTSHRILFSVARMTRMHKFPVIRRAPSSCRDRP
jgi:hypothetical protein